MLEYVKVVLSKVSFDKKLYEKELAKAINLLNEEEIGELKAWCSIHYRSTYSDINDRCFNLVTEQIYF